MLAGSLMKNIAIDKAMSRTTLATILTVSLSGLALTAQEPAAKWWAHVVFLANDSMNGRDTGSPEHRKAAEYIAAEFKKAGLEPGGTHGYFQPIRFRSRRIIEAQSSLALVRPGGAIETVELGEEATFSMRIEPAPSVEAPIVFAGYGLQVPEAKHDDLAGLDLKGRSCCCSRADRRTSPVRCSRTISRSGGST